VGVAQLASKAAKTTVTASAADFFAIGYSDIYATVP
jgi:hypothetical protein